jgi:hypothetical protein
MNIHVKEIKSIFDKKDMSVLKKNSFLKIGLHLSLIFRYFAKNS